MHFGPAGWAGSAVVGGEDCDDLASVGPGAQEQLR